VKLVLRDSARNSSCIVARRLEVTRLVCLIKRYPSMVQKEIWLEVPERLNTAQMLQPTPANEDE
jgi:hypothetical protein